MKGRISNYRRGVHTEYTNQYVVETEAMSSPSPNGWRRI